MSLFIRLKDQSVSNKVFIPCAFFTWRNVAVFRESQSRRNHTAFAEMLGIVAIQAKSFQPCRVQADIRIMDIRRRDILPMMRYLGGSAATFAYIAL